MYYPLKNQVGNTLTVKKIQWCKFSDREHRHINDAAEKLLGRSPAINTAKVKRKPYTKK
jgi:hypothetical protein